MRASLPDFLDSQRPLSEPLNHPQTQFTLKAWSVIRSTVIISEHFGQQTVSTRPLARNSPMAASIKRATSFLSDGESFELDI